MMQNYPFDEVPFWEYSNFLIWLNTNPSIDINELPLVDSKRKLENIRGFQLFLLQKGIIRNTEQIDKAINVIISENSVKLIHDIPYIGNEYYRRTIKKGRGVPFFIYDKWILIILDDCGWNWITLYEKANSVNGEKFRLCSVLRQKMDFMGYSKIRDLIREEIFETDFRRAVLWFYDKGDLK